MTERLPELLDFCPVCGTPREDLELGGLFGGCAIDDEEEPLDAWGEKYCLATLVNYREWLEELRKVLDERMGRGA